MKKNKVTTMTEYELQKLGKDFGDTVYLYAKSFLICQKALAMACTRTNDRQVKIIANEAAVELEGLSKVIKKRYAE